MKDQESFLKYRLSFLSQFELNEVPLLELIAIRNELTAYIDANTHKTDSKQPVAVAVSQPTLDIDVPSEESNRIFKVFGDHKFLSRERRALFQYLVKKLEFYEQPIKITPDVLGLPSYDAKNYVEAVRHISSKPFRQTFVDAVLSYRQLNYPNGLEFVVTAFKREEISTALR